MFFHLEKVKEGVMHRSSRNPYSLVYEGTGVVSWEGKGLRGGGGGGPIASRFTPSPVFYETQTEKRVR